MSPKREDGKMCPGVTKGGNPCKNYWNDNDPDGFCSHCRRRVQAAAKAKKNEEKRLAKAETEQTRQLDYDPEKTVVCAARPDCGKEMVMGSEGTPECVKTVNPSKMAKITRITRSKRSPLEEKQFTLAKAFQSRLLTLKEGGGPFPVCPDCQQQLMRFFGRDDIFLPLSFAQRKYQGRKDEEQRRQDEAEAKIMQMQQEAEEQRLRREQQEREREQKLLSQADAFMVGMEVDDSPKEERKSGEHKPTQQELSHRWARELFDGELDENNCPPVFLPKVDPKDVHVCSNPHCSERGTMDDAARDEDGMVILIDRGGEEIPLPKMWISWQPLRIVHKQGNLKGQVIYDDQGKLVVKSKPVVLCSQCGKILRGVPHKDERDAWTTPLSVAVEKAVAKKYKKDVERYESGNTSDQKRGQNQRGRGFKARNNFSFGHADPDDVQAYAGGKSRQAAIATFGEVADSKRRYNC